MKAITRNRYGAPDVLHIQEIEKPVPKKNEVLVRVYATTVNRTDCALLMAKPFIMRFGTGLFNPRSQGMGTDFAGEIEAVGQDVTEFKVGDKVWGFDDSGLNSQAEYTTIAKTKAFAKMPENASYEEAAASIEGTHYARNFINKVPLQAGDKVLINGATGAIGSATLQLAKYYGATVTAVGNTKNLDLLQSLGADRVIDYTKEDFTKDKEQYHYIFDAVGKSSFGKCKPLLLPKGVYMSSELGPGAENIYLPLTTRISGGKKVIFPFPLDIPKTLRLVKELIEKGAFKPVIDRTYPMEQIREAYEYVASGQKTGSVVVRF